MPTKYTKYITTGTETLPVLCKILSVTPSELFSANRDLVHQGKPIDLQTYQCSIGQILAGLEIKVPYHNTGNIEDNINTYEVHQLLEELGSPTVGLMNSYHSVLDGLGKDSSNSEQFLSNIVVFTNGVAQRSVPLPVIPQEFSDSNSASFSEQDIFGRSVSYQIYNGSARSVSFTLQLHGDMFGKDNYEYIHQVVRYIESACYPNYVTDAGIVAPPEIQITVGSQFRIRGILESVGAVWKTPMINGKYINCDLSISIKETSGPYSSDDIAGMGGNR